MAIAALVTWLITAGFGFFMLIRWATRGGLREVPGAGTNFPRVRVFVDRLPGHGEHPVGLDCGRRPHPGRPPGRAAGQTMDKRRPGRYGRSYGRRRAVKWGRRA